MTERPLNAETPAEYLTSWITPNAVFFDRNQGAIPPRRIALRRWRLAVEGEVETPITLTFDRLCRMPKAIAADTLECSGNGRSLLGEKTAGNPWTIGGVGNAVWGGVWLQGRAGRSRPETGGPARGLRGVRHPPGLCRGQVHPQHPAGKGARVDPARLRDERRAPAAQARLSPPGARPRVDRRQLREMAEPHR